MPRSRTAAPDFRGRDRTPGHGELRQTAERMISQIEDLVGEIAALRDDNEQLRVELRDAVDMLQRASAALGTAAPTRGRRRGATDRAAAPAGAAGRVSRGRRRAAQPGRGRGRATPESVTPEVVRAAIGKLGRATAKEIADEISRAGVSVSGRAIRFLAPAAGAKVEMVDGQRQYRL